MYLYSLTPKIFSMETLKKKTLNNPFIQTKAYWLILKTFYNKKKILLIPHLLVKDRFVIDIKKKANILNSFFAEE